MFPRCSFSNLPFKSCLFVYRDSYPAIFLRHFEIRPESLLVIFNPVLADVDNFAYVSELDFQTTLRHAKLAKE